MKPCTFLPDFARCRRPSQNTWHAELDQGDATGGHTVAPPGSGVGGADHKDEPGQVVAGGELEREPLQLHRVAAHLAARPWSLSLANPTQQIRITPPDSATCSTEQQVGCAAGRALLQLSILTRFGAARAAGARARTSAQSASASAGRNGESMAMESPPRAGWEPGGQAPCARGARRRSGAANRALPQPAPLARQECTSVATQRVKQWPSKGSAHCQSSTAGHVINLQASTMPQWRASAQRVRGHLRRQQPVLAAPAAHAPVQHRGGGQVGGQADGDAPVAPVRRAHRRQQLRLVAQAVRLHARRGGWARGARRSAAGGAGSTAAAEVASIIRCMSCPHLLPCAGQIPAPAQMALTDAPASHSLAPPRRVCTLSLVRQLTSLTDVAQRM